MKTILNTLTIQLNNEQLENNLLNIESLLLENRLNFYIDDINFTINILNDKLNNKKDVGLRDYANEGKIVKNILIKLNITNDKDYLKLFSIKSEEIKSESKIDNEKEINYSELDKKIYKVEKDDPKLIDILNKIKKVKK